MKVPDGITETVLVIEDDHSVRNIVREMLQRSGYTVMEASDGAEGVDVYRNHGKGIHLIISDVIMPKKNGRQVYDEIKQLNSNAKVLFMSGYSADILDNRIIRENGHNFIAKPMRPQDLLGKIREILDT
ncbi:MAG: response regulator [Thermodesulfovibrionales bacterium]